MLFKIGDTFENIPSFSQKISRLGLNIWQKSRKIDKLAVPNKSVQGESLVEIR